MKPEPGRATMAEQVDALEWRRKVARQFDVVADAGLARMLGDIDLRTLFVTTWNRAYGEAT